MDGTLLNSEALYHKVLKDLCEKFGERYTKDLEAKVYGKTDRDMSTIVVKELKLPVSPEEFERQLILLTQNLFHNVPLQKGVKRLLTHLYDNKIPMALATNSTDHAVLLHAAARPELFNLFHHKVSITDPEVYRGKPNPDVFLVAASRFSGKPKPHQCLVFEDSPVGVEAARQADMQVIMIPEPNLDREKTRRATLVIRSLMDFKPQLFGLPPFDDTVRRTKY